MWSIKANYYSHPTVKQLKNFALHVLHKFFTFNKNTTAFCLDRPSLHLLLLKSIADCPSFGNYFRPFKT